ncbi:2-amino-4-hydroxy-6-hydroxymethyldihydropteridine diphosphokinase [Paraferrimonas haliotis]|uniref:2-amino-4-hydroxy-6-hydroxymethyldihydropteridine pyrophosphokinase n=1 Tax=Paraferrimonas haliotis TaxID=2013866 RepID=A0AA37TRN7_9GAMM|nr:2-amino-4-hydroxy-6-hydroxymethyldihydropteridine diphosphokinase [Paraferrimonas haliotis]GLS83146.1 2-amino-4-hydroxy-6-hydroxymethyldihydropteridine diphosphokinase [Paraferrimonas haliotis]
MQRCFIGLGANLEQPIQQLQQALQALAKIPRSQLVTCSQMYHSKPMGSVAQPDYVNAVAELSTDLEPLELLDAMQAIENQQGRVREQRWGPRTLDLDLLLYGQQVIELPRLTVPHYGLQQRRFVLQPLVEIAPQLRLPDGSLVEDWLQSNNDPALVPVATN